MRALRLQQPRRMKMALCTGPIAGVTNPLRGEVQALVDRGRRLLANAVREGWLRGLLQKDPDAVYPGALGPAEIEHLVADEVAEEEAATPRRLRNLCRSIRAEAAAEDVLALCLAAELDGRARALAAYLRGGAPGASLNVATLCQALGEERSAEILAMVADSAPLRRHRLIEVGDRTSDLGVWASVRVAARLVRWLTDPLNTQEIAELAVLVPPELRATLSSRALAALEPVIDDVRRFVEEATAGWHMVLRGPRGSGRREAALEALRRLGRPVLVAHMERLAAQPDPTLAAGALLREAVLTNAQILLEGWDDVPDDGAHRRLANALAASTGPLLVSTSGDDLPRLAGWTPLVRELEPPVGHVRDGIVRELLPSVDPAAAASLRIGVGALGRVAEAARVRARGVIEAGDVMAAVRAEFEQDLHTVATRVRTSQTWEDLVLPADTRRTIDELTAQIAHRATVLGRWGFQRKLGRGLGTTALFTGEPGTGKSMVAGLVARELGLDLYQIDLSRVLSKWIGETEKNLARVFDAAEVGHVVLLFDEADALLARRTADVKSANDRHANLETNFILQRLEAFGGVAILTSNLEKAIDPAVARRLSLVVRFPFPDRDERLELWRRMVPAETPLADDVDFARLAADFELAGGHIRNIVLRAAYLAAGEGAPLSMAHLRTAGESEYRDRGMLLARGRLGK